MNNNLYQQYTSKGFVVTSLLSSAPVYFKIKKVSLSEGRLERSDSNASLNLITKNCLLVASFLPPQSAQLNPRGDFIFKDSSRRSTTRSQANLTSSCPELMSSLALSLDAIHPSLSLFKSTPPPVVITSKGVKRRIYKHSGASVEITPKPKNNTHPDQQEHCDSHEPGHFVEAEPFDVPFAVLVAVEQGTKMKIEGKMVSIREREMLVFRGDIMHQGVEYEVANRRIHAYFDSMDPMYSRPTNGRGGERRSAVTTTCRTISFQKELLAPRHRCNPPAYYYITITKNHSSRRFAPRPNFRSSQRT
jgi:hypothetical protein